MPEQTTGGTVALAAGAPAGPRRPGGAVTGAALLAVAAAVAGVALAADLPGAVVAVLGVAAVALAVTGAGRVGRALVGPGFDLGFWLATGWLCTLALAAVLADVLPLGNASDTAATVGVPGYAPVDLTSSNPLGTNRFGLDLLARAVHGARVSLLTVAFTIALSFVVGGAIGLVAGYLRGWKDHVIGLFSDALLVTPPLVLLIAFAAVLGPPRGTGEAVVKIGSALTVIGVPTMVRLARANTLTYAQREFVLASRAIGASHTRVMVRELLPNVTLPLMSYAFIVAAVLIVAEGSLAFLRLGLQQPEPSWGNMIAESGLRDLRRYPHVALVPGAFMFLTVYSLNLVGERARLRWDPREAKI